MFAGKPYIIPRDRLSTALKRKYPHAEVRFHKKEKSQMRSR